MIDLNELYSILRLAAMRGEIISYSDLSALYRERTGEEHSPHGTWDSPLWQLNAATKSSGLPPISAIVTYRIDPDDPDSQFVPPGNEFWGSPGVPNRPPTAELRELEWMRLVGRVHQEKNWTEFLPGLNEEGHGE